MLFKTLLASVAALLGGSHVNAAPNFMPCVAKSGLDTPPEPFCNTSLTIAERVSDLLSRMTLGEKCGQVADGMYKIQGTGFGGYNWNTECLHGLGATCLTLNNETRCPTIFAAPPGLGATFNRTVPGELGRIISDEIRAYTNNNGHRKFQNRGIGVSAWGPNLNIYRDPRWGRNQEVPSEDPYHSGSYGVAYTKGLQWGPDPKYIKAIGALKHYTMYSVESTRGRSYFEISSHDVEDTYLPQFKAAVVEAQSLGYMCSYAALTNPELIPDSGELNYTHSEPACASEFLAITKMVKEYGFEGYVQSDCGAVINMKKREHWAVNMTDAAAKSLKYGMMNSNCGGGMTGNICPAIAEGLVSEADLDARVTRSFTLLMRAGLFDPLADQMYTNIPFETINSVQSQASSLEASRQSFVLLKNPTKSNGETPVLPLKPSMKIALIGPHANTSIELAGSYFEDIGVGTCAGPSCIPTVTDGIQNITSKYGGKVSTFLCQDIECTNASITDAMSVAADADAIVFAMGINGEIEHEGADRMDIRMPGLQMNLSKAIIEANSGKPIVLLLFNGGMVTIEELKLEDIAIVECWYPGASGGISVGEMLFGQINRFGKLPFTYYAYNYTQQSDFFNMNMTKSGTQPGRTYKYLTDPSLALWPFGYGLSYTEFSLTSNREHFEHVVSYNSLAPSYVTASVTVKNIGDMKGDEVVFLYLNSSNVVGPNDPLALKQLIDYERVTLDVGESQVINFNVSITKFATVDRHGTRHVLAGAHEFIYSRGHGQEIQEKVTVDLGEYRRAIISTMEGYTINTGVNTDEDNLWIKRAPGLSL